MGLVRTAQASMARRCFNTDSAAKSGVSAITERSLVRRPRIAGVLRLDDIDAGKVGWTDVYPYATALAQNSFNLMTILGIAGERRDENARNSSFGLWVQFLDFKLEENFTGFLNVDENGNTPGDLSSNSIGVS